VLYSFGSDYFLRASNLVFDQAGNLYGTNEGALCYRGSVFELKPGTGNTWTEEDLYVFCSKTNCEDGSMVQGGVILDTAGNLYGTATCGGSKNLGVVFELTHGKGGWTEKVLHNFGNGTDGALPYGGVIMDAAGNLWGTTSAGGADNGGTVFEMSPRANGTWNEEVLFNFKRGPTGYVSGPLGGVVFDRAGNLFGTTIGGGPPSKNCDPSENSCGRVFELMPGSNGKWTGKIVHYFSGPDGANPWAGVTLDKTGNVYGTTYWGGAGQCYDGYGYIGCGVVFRMSPLKTGKWTETVLHSFDPNGFDGLQPIFALMTSDSDGNLYSTTSLGGTRGAGTVFKMTKHRNGEWTEKVIYNFGRYGDGAEPGAGVIFGATGKLYGTTVYGGKYGEGVVFEVDP
jgi:uncharacterized repeat protein (TIGR03803 family)